MDAVSPTVVTVALSTTMEVFSSAEPNVTEGTWGKHGTQCLSQINVSMQLTKGRSIFPLQTSKITSGFSIKKKDGKRGGCIPERITVSACCIKNEEASCGSHCD